MSTDFRAAIRPPSPLSPPDWMTKNVRIQNSERSANFDIEQTPWWRVPLELAADNSVHEIVVLAPTGSGKSTIAEGLCPYIVSEDPGPFLYASQTDPDAKFWVESRALPAMKQCRALDHLWPKDTSKSRKAEIIWPHMPMVFGGANKSNFQEKSIRWGYGDEVWTWDPGLVREFLARHHNRWNRRFYLVSQAGEVGDDLDVEWGKTDQGEWSWKCPECGSRHAYARKDLKYDEIQRPDGTLDAQKSADTARMVCPDCEAAFDDQPINRRKLTDSGCYVSKAEGLTGFRGFHIHALAVWWVPWREYVLELIAAKALLDAGDVNRWRQLRQKRDALSWKDDMAIERREFTVAERDKEAVAREPQAKIEGETHRFLTIDRGGDHFWAVVRAWCPGGPTVQLHEGYVAADGGKERYLRELQERFGVEDHRVFLDISYEWEESAQLCADHGWIGIRGEGETRSFSYKPPTRPGQKPQRPVERLFSQFQKAKGSRGGLCRYVRIATNPLKDVLWRLMNGKGLRWEVLPDVSKAYRRHMKAEIRREEQIGRSKRVMAYWEVTDRANHLFDCEVYQVAAAQMCGLFAAADSEE